MTFHVGLAERVFSRLFPVDLSLMVPSPASSDQTIGSPSPAASSFLQRWGIKKWQFWLGTLLSLVFLYLAFRKATLADTLAAMREASPWLLGAAVASFVLSVLAKAARWRLLLSAHKAPALGRVFSIYSVGQMVNTFLPGPFGELVRAYMLGEAEADSKVYVLGTVGVERVADLLFLLLSLLVLLSQMTLPAWLISPAHTTEAALIAILVVFILLVWQRRLILRFLGWAGRFIPERARGWLLREVHFALDSLDSVRRPSRILGLLFWSLLVTFFSTLTNYLVLLALGIALPFWVALLLLVVLQVGTQIPSSPGGVGIFQYLILLTLSFFGVEANLALGYSLLLYLVASVSIVPIGCYGLWHERISWQELQKAAVVFGRLKSRARRELI